MGESVFVREDVELLELPTWERTRSARSRRGSE